MTTPEQQAEQLRRGEVDVEAELLEGREWSPEAARILDRLYKMAIDNGLWEAIEKEYSEQLTEQPSETPPTRAGAPLTSGRKA